MVAKTRQSKAVANAKSRMKGKAARQQSVAATVTSHPAKPVTVVAKECDIMLRT
jgi:hypothetical protein